LDKTVADIAGTFQVSVDIQNTGKRVGKETVQLYIQDVIATVSIAEMELQGFAKTPLNPGEKKELSFKLGPEHLALYNRHLERVVERGKFKVKIGDSSDAIRLEESIWVK
jgi:beta-glucosidase